MLVLPRVLLLFLFLNPSFLVYAGKNSSTIHKNSLARANKQVSDSLSSYEEKEQHLSQTLPPKNTKDPICFFQKKAKRSLPTLESSLKKVTEQVAGSSYFLAPSKTRKRIEEKIKNDKKKPEEILDYARATLSADSVEGLEKLLKALKA